jgi:hypothetical protein
MSERMDDNSKQQPSNEVGEPSGWDSCTARLSITFLPTAQGERRVILGCNTHNDPPIIETVCETDLGEWPLLVTALLDQLKRRLPERAALAAAKQQAEVTAQENAQLAQQKMDENRKTLVPTAQSVIPNLQEEIRDAETTDAKSFHDDAPAIPVNGKQPSLFG